MRYVLGAVAGQLIGDFGWLCTAQEIVDDRCHGDGHPKQVNMTYALCAMKNALVRR